MDNVHVCYYGNSPELKKILRLYDFIDLQANPDYQFQPNHRYLIIGPEAYKVIVEHQRIHLGPRREGFYDIQKMDYLRTRNGIIFKFVYVRYARAQNWITKQQYETMLPHLEQIQQKFKDASLKEIHSKRTGKDYWLFEYKTFADLNDDCSDFLNKDDYVIADPPHVDYYKIVRTKEDIKNSMEYFINQDKGRRFGYDFETCHGFPFDNQYFEPMGLGIADLDGICAYFDIEYYRHCTDYYQYFLDYLKRFLDKHGDQVYTYNVGFELRVTYLMLHEMYPFQDAAAINKLEGDVAYNLTLKYTAMRHCHVASWDDSFEEMQEYLGSLMNSPGQHFDLDTYNSNMQAWTLENYDQSDDWAYLMEHYGEEESEFRRLIKQSWGDCFGAIPSNILGKYCCQDAYYTLLIRQRSDELGYTDDAWNCFSHNLRLGAHLNIDGCFVNHEEFEFQHYVCHTINAYGVLNLTYLVADIELEKLQDINIEDIPEVTGIMKFGCNFLDSKSLMRCLQDNQFEVGFNTDKAVEVMGQDLVDFIINQLKDWDRYPMQDGLFRARRFWEVLDENLRKRWNVEVGDKEITLMINDQHYVIDKNIDRITYKYRLMTTTKEIEYYLAQCDPNTPIRSMVSPTGEVIAIENFLHMYEWLINFNSAEVFKEFICNYYMRMWDVIYLARDEDHFLENLEKNEYPHLEFKDLKQYYKINNTLHVVKYVRFMDRILFDKIINKCTKLNSDLVAKCKLMIPDGNSDNDDWWVSQAQKNAYISEQDVIYYNQCKVIIQCCKDYRVHKNELLFANRLGNHNEIILKVLDLKKPDHYGEEEAKIPFSINNTLYAMLDRLRGYYTLAYETELKWVSKAYIVGIYWDLDDWNQTQEFYKKIPTFDIREKSFRGLAKYAWCYYSMRKYNKVLTTYIDGMMTDTARYCAEYDDNGVGAKRWEGSGPMWKAFPHYDVCQKKSKRWASNFHTIPSHNEIKRIITTPPGYLMSYFDISGMEVRTLAYLAQDEFMLNNYAKGIDPYIQLGKLADPGHDEKFYKAMRADFKTMLLGSLYGMGIPMMASRMNKSIEEASRLHELMFTNMKGIKKLIEHKGQYPFDHNGRVETILGDKLSILNEPQDRWGRLGNNLCIQGGSSTLMADAFENIIQHSYTDKEVIIRPLNVVHDSSQNYFQAHYIFKIDQFYKLHMRKYLFDKYGIDYAFDTLIGDNYFDMAELAVIDDKTIQLKGSYISLTKIIAKLDSCNVKYKILDVKHKKRDESFMHDGVIDYSEFRQKGYPSFVSMFYNTGLAPSFNTDESEYRMILHDES